MRLWGLVLLVIVLVGCAKASRIDRLSLDERYQATQLAQGVLSAVPLGHDASAPPTVVNWWYAGTVNAEHELVLRRLTWDPQGKPVGHEARYRIASDQLAVPDPIERTGDARYWVALHEAALGIPPPSDLPTAWTAPKAFDPIELKPRESPSTLEPAVE